MRNYDIFVLKTLNIVLFIGFINYNYAENYLSRQKMVLFHQSFSLSHKKVKIVN